MVQEQFLEGEFVQMVIVNTQTHITQEADIAQLLMLMETLQDLQLKKQQLIGQILA
jgi:hypothetical protein